MAYPKTKIILCAAVAAACLASFAGPAQSQGLPPRIKLGVLQPFTGSGAQLGADAKITIEMTIRDINAAGGMGGRQVDIVYGDDATDPTRAVTEATRLIDQEKVHILSGPGVAAVALAVAPITTRAKILSTPYSGTKAINPTSYPYGFSPYYPSDAFMEALVDYTVDTLKAKNIGLMVDTGGQGQGAAEVAKQYIPKRGAKITDIEAADFQANDYTPQLLRLKSSNPDVVIQVTSYAVGVANFYKATDEMNWKIRIVGQNSSNFPDQVIKITGPDAYKSGRLIGLTTKAATYCPGDDVTKAPFVKWREELKAFSPNWQHVANPINPAYSDQLNLIKAAVDATKSVDGPTLAAWIEKNGDSVPGISGKISVQKGDHFMFHSDIFTFSSRPDVRNEQGLSVREGC
jgi:branched-chain amino acid transport system substrate-binding protein